MSAKKSQALNFVKVQTPMLDLTNAKGTLRSKVCFAVRFGGSAKGHQAYR